MIGIEKQNKLLVTVSRELKKKVTAYAIGGTAMMILGLKDATLDIDLVFENEEDRKSFKKAIKAIGYKEMDPIEVYGAKNNIPEMLTLGDERFDLFVEQVINFYFSKEIQKRAKDTHQFGDKLIIKIANPHDIILMKCATDRIKDKDDCISIIKNTKINWEIIVAEAKNQVKLGKHAILLELGEFLEDLKKILKEKIPQTVLNNIYNLLMEQVKEKTK